jgi:hypothetical protein
MVVGSLEAIAEPGGITGLRVLRDEDTRTRKRAFEVGHLQPSEAAANGALR